MLNYTQVLKLSEVFGNPIIRQKDNSDYCIWIIAGRIDYFKANLVSSHIAPKDILKEGEYIIDSYSQNNQARQSDVWIKVSKESVDNLAEIYRQMSLHQMRKSTPARANIHCMSFMDSYKRQPFGLNDVGNR